MLANQLPELPRRRVRGMGSYHRDSWPCQSQSATEILPGANNRTRETGASGELAGVNTAAVRWFDGPQPQRRSLAFLFSSPSFLFFLFCLLACAFLLPHVVVRFATLYVTLRHTGLAGFEIF